MADYRFSAQVISRSKGQSSVASAAYRSGLRLDDERTGEIHDYSRKGGVLHSEVLAPEGTPEWQTDRTQLWNAVEAVERRKDAQLAREIQLSLPHELTADQRQELAVTFAQEQFVNHGMIADIAIHAPSAEGDERNHHAHIMLTMRELTGEGFGNKQREWNKPELLEQWREEWANHQNRALERHGHEARVSHLSYEAQGIDREPQQHLGPVASDMERNGKASRIGDENRSIANDNLATVIDLAQEAKKRTLAKISDIDRNEIQAEQDLKNFDLSQKHDRQKTQLENRLEEMYGTTKATIKAEVSAIDRRLQAKGVRKILRSVFGQARSDKETRRQMTASLADIDKRENEARGALERQQAQERTSEARKQNERRERYVKDRQEQRETGRPAKTRGTKRTGRPERAKVARKVETPVPTQTTPQKATTGKIKTTWKQSAEPENKPLDEPTLAEKKTLSGHAPEKGTSKSLKRPWESKGVREGNKRPWESDLARGRRTGRKPSPSGGSKP